MHNTLGILAAVLALVATVPYVRSILRGQTKPSRATWFIWDIEAVSLLASYYYAGASTTIWLTLAYTVTTTIIFVLSLKYGVGGFERLDMVCLAGAILGLVLWWLTDNPVTALYTNVLVDGLGFLPTLKKAYSDPESEDRLAWSISTLGTICNVAALTTWQFKIALYPVYNCLFSLLIVVFLSGVLRRPARRAVQRASVD